MISFAAKQINPQVINSKITGFYSNTDDFLHNLKFNFFSDQSNCFDFIKKRTDRAPCLKRILPV